MNLVNAARNTICMCALVITAMPVAAAHPDSARLEFSFGTSQMFISESNRAIFEAKEKMPLPTQSALFLGEFFLQHRFAALMIYNLPLTTQKTIVDSKLVEKKASPYLGLGMRWAVASARLWNRITLEPHIAFSAGPMILQDWSLEPVVVAAGRIHIASREGFTMYFGGFYTFGVNAPSLIYGVGHCF